MYSCKPFAERRRARRALSILEVMISQVIAVILVTALTSLVVAMTRKMHSETSASDAQVRLREATHMLLRDTQGIGGDISQSGDILTVVDGGATAPDSFTLFKRDESVCGGGVKVKDTNGVNVNADKLTISGVSGVCPFDLDTCSEAEVEGRRILLIGDSQSLEMTGHNASGGTPCKLNFPGGQQGDDVVANYNNKYDPDASSISDLLSKMAPLQMLVGTQFVYRLSTATASGDRALQRSIDGGATFEDILEHVVDLQVERIYDINGNGVVDAGETVTASSTATSTELPAGADATTFLGLRIGLVTFGRAPDGMEVRPPTTFSNRTLSGFATGRRYRASFVLSAARNRRGV